jgi:E3 ubiquitin-protein ligase RAD18
LHIDNCKGPLSYNLRPLQASQPQPIIQKMGPLPTLNYAVCTEKALRTLLAKLDVSTLGNKATLMARHKEYVTLYNANIDRQHPRSLPALRRELERWEAARQSLQKEELDFGDWHKKRKGEYSELTRLARESAKKRKFENEDVARSEPPSAIQPSQEEIVP